MVTCMPMDVCQLLVLYSLYMPIACFINTVAGVPQTKTKNEKAKICYTFLWKRTPNHHQNIEFWRRGINGNRSCQELLDLRVAFTLFFSASLRNKFSPLAAVRKLWRTFEIWMTLHSWKSINLSLGPDMFDQRLYYNVASATTKHPQKPSLNG